MDTAKWVTPADAGVTDDAMYGRACSTFILEIAPGTQQLTSDYVFFLAPRRRRARQSFGKLTSDAFLVHASRLPLVSATGAPGVSGSSRDVLQILRSLSDI